MSFKIVAGAHQTVMEFGGDNSTLEEMIEKAKSIAKKYEIDEVLVLETKEVFSTKRNKKSS
jgi:hypothetical protein